MEAHWSYPILLPSAQFLPPTPQKSSLPAVVRLTPASSVLGLPGSGAWHCLRAGGKSLPPRLEVTYNIFVTQVPLVRAYCLCYRRLALNHISKCVY